MANWTHVFQESGNGFPGVGSDVIFRHDDGDIELLTVTAISRIHTQQWKPNYVYLECEAADTKWSKLSESIQDRLYNQIYHVGTREGG